MLMTPNRCSCTLFRPSLAAAAAAATTTAAIEEGRQASKQESNISAMPVFEGSH